MTPNGYHYTESGLDAVYLVNGYRFVESARGRQVIIENIDGLHRAIGRSLVCNKKDLSGKEIRFLRIEMGMSQTTLAKLLKVSEQAVHRWENGKTGTVPKPAESLVRLLYSEHTKDNNDNPSSIRSILKRLANLEDEINELQSVRLNSNADWEIASLEKAA